MACFEKLDRQVSLSKTRKTFEDQKNTKLQNGCSEKNENAYAKCWNPASVTLICDFIAMGLHRGPF